MTAVVSTPQPYPEYKDSGVPWFGEIPAHWDIKRLGSLLQERGENNSDGKMEQVLSVLRDVGVIRYEDKGNIGNKRSEDITRYKIVRCGDIVVNSMNVIIGSVGLSKYDGCLSPVYYVLKPRSSSEEAAYFNSIFQLRLFQQSLVRLGNGILAHRMRIPMELLKCELIPRPPLDEQRAIVRFLDHIDRRVNRFIRAKRKLVALLNEQKQAIIHQAVTRGLDPDVRLKPSGVEWLGDVPEGWTITQIRSISNVVRGGSPRPAGSPLYFFGQYMPWITVAELTKDDHIYLVNTSTKLTELGTQFSRVIDEGTLLLTNSGATLGVPKISHIRGCINDGVAAFLRLRPNINKEYMYFYWITQTKHLKAWVDLGAQPNLNTQIIGGWPVLIPSKSEQDHIVEYIKHEIVEFNKVLERTEREIDLIREYHTRLIADVVTGKLDVRNIEFAAESGLAEFDDMLESDEAADSEDLELVEEDIDADD